MLIVLITRVSSRNVTVRDEVVELINDAHNVPTADNYLIINYKRKNKQEASIQKFACGSPAHTRKTMSEYQCQSSWLVIRDMVITQHDGQMQNEQNNWEFAADQWYDGNKRDTSPEAGGGRSRVDAKWYISEIKMHANIEYMSKGSKNREARRAVHA